MSINYAGVSGGKDSQATALWMIHDSGYNPTSLRFTFCNTHNESPLTYDHIHYLSEYFVKHGAAAIKWLEPERGFLELAKWKQRFPSRKAQFCTQFLKLIPTREDVSSLLRIGHDVLVHSGVRREEANGNPDNPRFSVPEREFDDGFGCFVFRPILFWNTEAVIAYSKRFGLRVNPLYGYGARRVGCFPCVNSRKDEIRSVAEHFPERIDEIRHWEREVSSSFYSANKVPDRFKTSMFTRKHTGLEWRVASIDDVVRWSRTGKRAIERGRELFPILGNTDAGLACPSGMGMCE